MWFNKKIVVTNHAVKRFEERHINYSRKIDNPIKQILVDLKPLNVRHIEKVDNEHNKYKVTTQHNKVYILQEFKNAYFVKTVYKNKRRFS